ncbi:MAG TPA: sigma-70 family RNA polymerase sigma factor [Planctomycetota bacterium]|nr:sigma-70 family RNA polymerase sigma factor [Planctomycetota bacterium]
MGSVSVERQDAGDLGEFVRTGSSAAFERLARRYAGLVFSACMRRLGKREDAEDASQAVFLILARRAGAVDSKNLASWLHGTCLRASSMVARARQRRAHHEEEAAAMGRTVAGAVPAEWAEARQRLDGEIAELPGKLREAVSRHYLAGQSHAELARELGVPEGTVASRVSAGLERLRQRMAQRGAVLSAAMLGSLLASEAQAAVPASLLASLPHLASGVAVASAAAGTGVSIPMVVEGVLKMMFWSKVKTVATLSACGLVLAVAVPMVTSLAGDTDKPAVEKPADKPADKPMDKPAEAKAVTGKVTLVGAYGPVTSLTTKDGIKVGDVVTCKAKGWTGSVTAASEKLSVLGNIKNGDGGAPAAGDVVELSAPAAK